MTQHAREVVLEARNVSKIFPGVVANKNVNLVLHKGEVLALLGENGAGKTTLMNILYGLYHQDGGEILVHGKAVRIKSPRQAIDLSIGMVHQHFMLVPVFTVAENIVLGMETSRNGRLDLDSARTRIRDLSQRYKLEIDPDAYVKDLSVGQQQRVEIVKALYRNAQILILDEPTAVLTPQEADELFVVLRELVAQGTSIIFISHKLREVLAIADRIVVLRRGEVVGEVEPRDATPQVLAEMMVGRSVLLQVAKEERAPGEVVLSVQDLVVTDDRKQIAVDHLSFEVRAGEVVGVAGVQGNGQTELVEALTGLRPTAGGRVTIAGQDLTNATPRNVFEAGTGHVPEDRQEHGLVLAYSCADNLVLNRYYQEPFAHGVRIDADAIDQNAEKLIKEYDVRTPSAHTPVSSLSGGNKQKVIIARELSRPLKLLIASQPTRGVDVGSIEFIHKNIIAERDANTAVLLVSAELDEVLALSDRIAVMYKGHIVGIVDAQTTTREQLGLMMAGVDYATTAASTSAATQRVDQRDVGGQGRKIYLLVLGFALWTCACPAGSYDMNILIGGGGKLGAHLAHILHGHGHVVILIEQDEQIAIRLRAELPSITVIYGDACNPQALRDANISSMHAVVATTGHDEDNLVIAKLAKHEFRVNRVIARINNPKNEWLFTKRMGVDIAISHAGMVARLIDEELTMGDLIPLLKLDGGNVSLAELQIAPTSRMVGRKIEEITLPNECVLVTVIRDGTITLPHGDTSFAAGDRIIALVASEHQAELARIFG